MAESHQIIQKFSLIFITTDMIVLNIIYGKNMVGPHKNLASEKPADYADILAKANMAIEIQDNPSKYIMINTPQNRRFCL